MGEKRAAVTAVAAVIGGVLLVAALVTWASSIGPSGVFSGEGPQIVRTTPTETESSPSDPFTSLQTYEQERLAKEHAGDRPLLKAMALVLEILIAGVVLILLYRSGRRAYQEYKARQRPPAEPDEVDFDVLAPDLMAERIEEDAAAQRDALLGGTPRNGIVECWHRFEVQAADAGITPYTWETSSEFTLRILNLVGADTHAVAVLAALYREARFSEHELDETRRAEALTALDALHADLRRANT